MKIYFQKLLPYAFIFYLTQTILRLSLLIRGYQEIDLSFVEITKIFVLGLWFDTVTFSFFAIPFALINLFISKNIYDKWRNILEFTFRFLFIFTLAFSFASEHTFWSEFTTRFNFIAVDYLVYTNEVLGNIYESYPIIWIVLGLFILSLILTKLTFTIFATSQQPSFKTRFASLLAIIAVSILLYSLSSYKQSEFSNNTVSNEVAANGIFNLFYAYSNNEIDYDRFYKKEDTKTVRKNIKNMLNDEYVAKLYSKNDFLRLIKYNQPEIKKNVIIISMESMSADYMGIFGNQQNLTPNLDSLANNGLSFTNLYATGTRTVRGLEAISLSIPPTPGQSIIRREGNENLFSIGYVFKKKGYDTKFIYGGHGYFDNMNYFFSHNNFDVIDRTDFKDNEVEFSNVWGVCDEDLFKKTISEADISYKNNTHFMSLVMTTSNHRPYTYPEGRIDIPSQSGGRIGGVKYADYSVGKLVELAKQKPWFKDTIFVFVADHTAGAGGKTELAAGKYHIPMIFYSPDFIKPQKFENIASQIDLAPILLGLMKFEYQTKFFGEDLLNDPDEVPHAFISNYQKVGLIEDGKLTVLKPKFEYEQLSWPDQQPIAKNDEVKELIDKTIFYYQSASWWKKKYKVSSN